MLFMRKLTINCIFFKSYFDITTWGIPNETSSSWESIGRLDRDVFSSWERSRIQEFHDGDDFPIEIPSCRKCPISTLTTGGYLHFQRFNRTSGFFTDGDWNGFSTEQSPKFLRSFPPNLRANFPRY